MSSDAGPTSVANKSDWEYSRDQDYDNFPRESLHFASAGRLEA
jgi:hypothetical protein